MQYFEQKIRKEYVRDDKKNAKHQFYWAFDKWRMLTMIQKIQTQAREGKEISGVVVQDAITNLLQRQKKDLLEEIEDFKQDIAR